MERATNKSLVIARKLLANVAFVRRNSRSHKDLGRRLSRCFLRRYNPVMPREKDSKGDTISFRLVPAFLTQLEERTELFNQGRRKKISRHDVARKMVVDALSDAQAHRHDELREEVAELHQAVATLRNDLATLYYAILTRAEPVQGPEAKRIIKETLLSKR